MKYLLLLSIVLYLSLANSRVEAQSSFLDKVGDKIKETAKEIAGVCVIDDNCNKNFFELNNYCCLNKAQCCDWFSYVFRNE